MGPKKVTIEDIEELLASAPEFIADLKATAAELRGIINVVRDRPTWSPTLRAALVNCTKVVCMAFENIAEEFERVHSIAQQEKVNMPAGGWNPPGHDGGPTASGNPDEGT